MAIETYIFTKKERIPTTEVLQRLIKEADIDYTLAPDFDIQSEEYGFHMGSFEGLESGCDYVIDPYDASDWDFEQEDKECLKDVDCVVTIGAFSNAQEMVAMLSIAGVLTRCSEGWLASEFFSDTLIPSDDAVVFTKEIIENSRDQFSGPSTTRQAILDSSNSDDSNDSDFNIDVEELRKNLQLEIDQIFGDGIEKIAEGLSHTDGYESGEAFAKEVISSLEEAGISLDSEIDLAFYLYVPNQGAAIYISDSVQKLNLKCHIEQEDSEDEESSWLCYLTKKMVPLAKDIEQIGDTLLKLTVEMDGEFDGWEVVPEYGFNPFENSYDLDECHQMAHSILQSLQNSNKPPHKYIDADMSRFEHLDLEKYQNYQENMEQKGFVYLGDIENQTISDMGDIVTFSRVMYHHQMRIASLAYYLEQTDSLFVEFSSMSTDGKCIITSNIFTADSQSHPDSIDALFVPFATLDEVEELHLGRIEPYSELEEIDTIEKLIALENSMLSQKYEHLKATGWISREALQKLSGGDETLTNCVYDALQKILEE